MKHYTIYTAEFQDGTHLTATSREFFTRLDFYNMICEKRLGKKYGRLLAITCRPSM